MSPETCPTAPLQPRDGQSYPNPCVTLGCAMQQQPVEVCRDHRCPYRWTREAAEDRKRREEKDRKKKEAAP